MYNLLLLTLFTLPLLASKPAEFSSRCWNAHQIFDNHSVNPPWLIIQEAQNGYLATLYRDSIDSDEDNLRLGLLGVTKVTLDKDGNNTDLDQNEAKDIVRRNAKHTPLLTLLAPGATPTDSLVSLCALEKAVRSQPDRFPYIHALALLSCHATIAAHFGAMDHAQQQLTTYFPAHNFTTQPLGDVTTALTEIGKLPQDSLKEVRKIYAVFPFARPEGKAALYTLAKRGLARDWKTMIPLCAPFIDKDLSAIIREYLLEAEFTDADLRWIKPPNRNLGECWDPVANS